MFSNHRGAVSEEKSVVLTTIILLVAAIPAIFAALWIHRYGIEVPWKDDWDAASLIVKAHTGQLTWSDLFEQQQEARYVLPKLLFIASSAGGHWDVRRLMMLSLLVCTMTALGLYYLLGKSGLGAGTKALCFWLMALLIFSAAQYELWPWASGFPCFLPAFFLVSALCILETKLSTAAKFIICALLATAASFTLPHGLLLWWLTFPLLVLRGETPKWRSWSAAWFAATAICAAVYFHGYARPAQVPEFAPAVPIFAYAHYFFAFLGGELAYSTRDDRITVAAAFGFVLFAFFLAAIVYAVGRKGDREFMRRLLPWFALGTYSIGSAILVSLGRVGFGIDSAISSRYVASSLYLSIAVVALTAIIAREISQRRRSFALAIAFYATSLLLCGAYLTLYACASARSVRLMEWNAAQVRLGRGALLFGQVLDTSALVRHSLYFDPATVGANAAALDQLKLLRPPLVRSREFAQIPHEAAAAKVASGEWEPVSLPNESYRVSGWAFLDARGRPADAVVLAYETAEKSWIAFALADEVNWRRHPRCRAREKKSDWLGWSATIPRDAIPANAQISAWALDAERPMLYRLKQSARETER